MHLKQISSPYRLNFLDFGRLFYWASDGAQKRSLDLFGNDAKRFGQTQVEDHGALERMTSARRKKWLFQ